MKSIEEDGLDKIFKQGLSKPGHLAEYREGDWDELEKMLDERKQKRPIVFWLPVISGIAAVLLLAFGWLYFQSNQNVALVKNTVAVNKHDNNMNNAPAPTKVTPAPDNGTNKNTGTSGGQINEPAVDLIQHPSSVSNTHKLAMGKPNRKDKSFFPLSVDPAARRDVAGLTNNVNTAQTADLRGTENSVRGNGEILAALNEQDIPDAQFIGADNGLPNIDHNKPEPIIGRNVGFDGALNSKHAQFAITVLASPDINGVGSFSQAQVGSNLGLMFSMGVSKFTFSTGAIYAKTPYTASASNYNIAYASKFTPDNISADCRVLDIPLNIDYQVYSKANNQFSVGSGLSSYIMLNENYTYNYNSPYGGYYPPGFSVTNQNRYFFGVLNLDATYQRKLNAKLSLEVQPYLKIPLTGIGAGEVKLQTAGVALGLKWNLNRLFKP